MIILLKRKFLANTLLIILLSFFLIGILNIPQEDELNVSANIINYQIIKPPFTEKINEALQPLLQKGGEKAIANNNQTFLLIALGERRTSGYKIEIKQITKTNSTLRVIYQEIKPKKDLIVSPVITYPSIVVQIPYRVAKVQFVKITN